MSKGCNLKIFSDIFDGWSIKVKLSFFLMVAACFVFFMTYLLVHHTLHTSLSKAENDFVYSRLHGIRAIVLAEPEYLEIIRKDIEWEGKYAPFPEYYLRLTDEAGHLLIETPGMGKMVLSPWFPTPTSRNSSIYKDVIRHALNGRYYLLKADYIDSPNAETKKINVQIALDVSSEVTIDEANHNKAVFLLVYGVLSLVGLGVLIIHKVLRPLELIVTVSERVTINEITGRIDPEGWPKELRRLAISFNAMLDRLEESLTRLSDCASNMAHEIRTPINNLMGEAEVALLKERTPEEYKEVLESGIEECSRISRLVNDLLFLARAENPAMCVGRTLFDPVKEIEEIFTFYAPQAEEKRADLTCHGKALLNGDPSLFRRAVSNLLANALYYSPPGVKVDITVRKMDERYLEVIVSDTGFGIAEEEFPRLFDRFYRGDRSRSNYAEGSGLGLSIVRAIMDLHGGSVAIRSKLGEGTTFTLRFPQSPAGLAPV